MVKYSDKPLFSLKTSYGEIEVGTDATFNLINKDISTQIYSKNENALKELNESFESIKVKYPDSYFMLKKDISYRIRLKIDSGASIQSANDHISDIADLFAILIYIPVYPESIRIVKKLDENQRIVIHVYPSMMLNKRTLELCTYERTHFDMPIKNSNINLASIMDTWLNTPINYSTIISSIQQETGFRYEHLLHGELVIYATQTESISYDAGVDKEAKYQYPLDTYGCDKIKDGIKKIFDKVGETDIGKGIAELRNEIAHIGKPKKLLSSLSMRDIIDISQYLQLTIIGYILDNLGVPKNIITDYQNKIIPNV